MAINKDKDNGNEFLKATTKDRNLFLHLFFISKNQNHHVAKIYF